MIVYISPSLSTLIARPDLGVAVTQPSVIELTRDAGFDNCGQSTGEHEIEFCLSGTEDISDHLNGLTMVAGGLNLTLENCVLGGNNGGKGHRRSDCPGTLYFCNTVEKTDHPMCVQSISTPGGETLTTCTSIGGECDNGTM